MNKKTTCLIKYFSKNVTLRYMYILNNYPFSYRLNLISLSQKMTKKYNNFLTIFFIYSIWYVFLFLVI